MSRLLHILLAFSILALPLLACGAPAALVANKQATAPGGIGGMSVPIPWDELAPTAPCRIAAAKAATVNGLLYSQGGAKPDNDPIDPQTGTFYSRTGPRSYDCSGMTQAAYAQAGVRIGANTMEQINDGTLVSCAAADLKGKWDFLAAHEGHQIILLNEYGKSLSLLPPLLFQTET